VSKAVVFSRSVQPEWLNRTVELYQETKDAEEVKKRLDEYLAGFINSDIVLKKTRKILLKTWVNVEDKQKGLRDEGVELYKDCSALEKAALHWAMLLAAFPLFKDTCAAIGKLSLLQEEITLAQIRRRVYELWGERSTLEYAIEKLLQTMRNFQVLERKRPGVYQVVRYNISRQEVIFYLLSVLMRNSGRLYVSFPELAGMAELFPFQFDVHLQALLDSSLFKVDRIGGELVVSV
jgi:hypothetical protein